MDEIIDGYPLYIYCISMTFQFALFPLLCVFYIPKLYQLAFISVMLKDFLVVTTDTAMNVHHTMCILFTILFSSSQNVAIIVTVGEVGSGAYNAYTLAKYYDSNVYCIYWFYAITMTLSNIYCLTGIYNIPDNKYSKSNMVFKLPLYGLLFMRQYYVHTIS